MKKVLHALFCIVLLAAAGWHARAGADHPAELADAAGSG